MSETSSQLALHLHPDTLVLPLSSQWYRLFQPITRRNALVDFATLAILANGREQPLLPSELLANNLQVIDATTYKLIEHAYCNSDNFSTAPLDELTQNPLPADEVIEFLTEAVFLFAAGQATPDLNKKHFADRFKGNFHEQIATECLMSRIEPQTWWVNQKFDKDLSTRLTPYHYIENRFLEEYIAQQMTGKSVIEIGCGTGYFTEKIAKNAEAVLGIDYNPQYIAMAKESAEQKKLPIEYRVCDITDEQFFLQFADQRFDYIVLIDTFLFLFDAKFQKTLFEKRHQIVKSITKLMNPNSILLIMDPHPFWLTPWIGSETSPLGIMTEYKNRKFKVIPSLSEMSSLLYDAGLRIRRIFEPDVDPEYEKIDSQAYHFMQEFPQWWVFEAELK
ncbi:hypothetical protein BH10PSE19_BH10PSE19_08370 [soil metagenome]